MIRWKSQVVRVVLSVSVLVYSTSTFGCDNRRSGGELAVISGTTMGTLYNIKIVDERHAGQNVVSRNLRADIENILSTVNNQMSTYEKESEISRFNRHRASDWFPVSSDTAGVIKEALGISRLSGGAFDITVGPLVDLWGFGPKTANGVPDRGQIKETLKIIGYENLSVNLSPPAIKKGFKELHCDLAAIAKGFGVDKLAAYLDSQNITSYLIEIGGELRTRGRNQHDRWWRIGIASPTDTFGIQKVIDLKNQSMATSGDYRNYYEAGGIRYSHTIDPRTGSPVTHNLVSVTVVCDSCMRADALATAITVLGPEKGYELALRDDLAVFFIMKSKQGFREKSTPLFRELLGSGRD